MLRTLRPYLTAASALLVLVFVAAPASAQKGTFSLGGNFGTGIYSNSELNDLLEGIGYEKVTSGWEYGGSIRYMVSNDLGLDLEFNRMMPKSTTSDAPDPDIEVTTPATAIPLNLVYTISANDSYQFNLFGGPGILTGAKLHAEQGSDEDEVDGKSSFYGQAGVEAQWKLSPTFALGARALGRIAKSTLEDSSPEIDMDLGGVAFGLGARLSFGGGGN